MAVQRYVSSWKVNNHIQTAGPQVHNNLRRTAKFSGKIWNFIQEKNNYLKKLDTNNLKTK